LSLKKRFQREKCIIVSERKYLSRFVQRLQGTYLFRITLILINKIEEDKMLSSTLVILPLLILLPRCHSGIPGSVRYDDEDEKSLQNHHLRTSPTTTTHTSSFLLPWLASLFIRDPGGVPGGSPPGFSRPAYTSVNPFAAYPVHNPANYWNTRRSGLYVPAAPISPPNVWNPLYDPFSRGPALGQGKFAPPILQTPVLQSLASPLSFWERFVSNF